MSEFVTWMNDLPREPLYALLWTGAALENVIPAIPADTFVALGGFLAGTGGLTARSVFAGTWAFNVAGAIFIYLMSHRYGRAFFERGLGRYVLRPHQMERVASFYDRWGTLAIFLSRFLPGIRAVVPVFAGATHQSWPRVVLPIALASAIWYGGLVRIGIFVGQNLRLLDALMARLNTTLGLIALGVVALVVLWWLRSRSEPDD